MFRENKGLGSFPKSKSLEQLGSLALEAITDDLTDSFNEDGERAGFQARNATMAEYKGDRNFKTPEKEYPLHCVHTLRTPCEAKRSLNLRNTFTLSATLTRSASQIFPSSSQESIRTQILDISDYRRLLSKIKKQVDKELSVFELFCEQATVSLNERNLLELSFYKRLLKLSKTVRSFQVCSTDLVTFVRFFKDRISVLEQLRKDTAKFQWSLNPFNISPVIKLLFVLSKLSRAVEEVDSESTEVEEYVRELSLDGDSSKICEETGFSDFLYPLSTNMKGRKNEVNLLDEIAENSESHNKLGDSESTFYLCSSDSVSSKDDLELCRICEQYIPIEQYAQHTTQCAGDARRCMKYIGLNKKLDSLIVSLDEIVQQFASDFTASQKESLFKLMSYISLVLIVLNNLESASESLEKSISVLETGESIHRSRMLESYKEMYSNFFSNIDQLIDRESCVVEHGLSLNATVKASFTCFEEPMKSVLNNIMDIVKDILEMRHHSKESSPERNTEMGLDECSTDESDCGSSIASSATDSISENSRDDQIPRKSHQNENNIHKLLLKKLSRKDIEREAIIEPSQDDFQGVASEVSLYCENFGDSSNAFKVPSINDFNILKPISRGAFGRVYLVKKKTTGDLYAVKVISKSEMVRKNLVNQVLAERDILAGIRTSFVVNFFWSFESKDKFFLVMEYVPGGDFYSLLQSVGYLEEPIVRQYLAEAVLALEELHSVGVIHRDLKPDNMLITRDGHLKLTDFGLSSFLSDEVRREKPIRDNAQPVGTPDYLAPEILLGSGHSFTVDWWCLGIVGYELLVGYPPFHDTTASKIFANILNRRLTWPDMPISSVTKDLVERLLEPDPYCRLGAKGSKEIKEHPFFYGIAWDNLLNLESAFKPNCSHSEDTSYFISRKPLVSLTFGEDSGYAEDSGMLGLNRGTLCTHTVSLKERQKPVESFSSSAFADFAFRNLDSLEAMNMQVLHERFLR